MQEFTCLEYSTPVVFAYMIDKAHLGTGLERELIQKVAEVEYHVLLPGVFSHCVRYGPIDCLAFPRMVSSCEGGGALLYIPLELIKSWFALGICRLLRNKAMDRVLALVAIGRLSELD